MNRIIVEPSAWEAGFFAAMAREDCAPLQGQDKLSYLSGYLEGRERRVYLVRAAQLLTRKEVRA